MHFFGFYVYFCTIIYKYIKMNYEDLLESMNGAALAKEVMPFGQFYKKMTDGKYVNVVDLHEELLDSLVFTDALTAECEVNKHLDHKGQLHFTVETDSDGICAVKVEQGTFHTYERLLEDSPAIVAGKSFIFNTVTDLLDLMAYLHDQGICHVCYAPNNVLSRKGDTHPLLLFHGSAYKAMNNLPQLFGESNADYLAPEVLENGTFDERSDIYSLGKFIEFLYRQSEIPIELRGVVKKATDPDPDNRYQTPEDMKHAMTSRKSLRESFLLGIAALLVVCFCFSLYFTLVPEREDIEFVKPAPKQADDDLLDDGGYGSNTDLDNIDDSLGTNVDKHIMKEYEAKAEQIFRKRFAQRAEAILSRIYDKEHMGSTSKDFMAGSMSTMEELVEVQQQLGREAGLEPSRSQLIATQIIDQVTSRLKARMEEREKAEKEGE